MKDDKLYLIHIGECIQRIETYVAGGRESFATSTLIQDAVLRNLQTLAESTQRLSNALKAAHPEVNWRDISGFRNVLVHDYLCVAVFFNLSQTFKSFYARRKRCQFHNNQNKSEIHVFRTSIN